MAWAKDFLSCMPRNNCFGSKYMCSQITEIVRFIKTLSE